MSVLEDISCAIDIDAPLARVWTVLSDEGLVAHWLGCIGFRPQVGALFYMQHDQAKRAAGDVTGATHCEIEALDPPERLAFSWFVPGFAKTHVAITLTPHGDGVTARLVHTGWDQFDAAQMRGIHEMLSGGWRSGVLPGLKRAAEAA